MPQEPINFANQQASGLSELGGASPVAHNVIIEATGAVRRRPGIVASENFTSEAVDPDGLEAIHATETGDLYAIGTNTTGKRQIHLVGPSGVQTLSEATDSDTYLWGTTRPVFAETEALLVIAGGAYPSKVDLVAKMSDLLGGSPPDATHVIAHAARLLVNDVSAGNRGRIWFSGQALGSSITGHEHWLTDGVINSTEGFYSAEGRPDYVVALAENTNEVFVFGVSTLQVFVPDAIGIYAPASQREFGCSAPYSIVKIDHQFVWLDQYRRFVMSDGRSQEIVSDPIQQTLNDLGTVSDCYGYRVVHGPLDAVVWRFPGDGRTFCFQKGGGWSQWSTGLNLDQFPVTGSAFHTGFAENLVCTSTGKVGKLSFASRDDLGYGIIAAVETGFLNRGTDMLKQCVSIKLALKRGTTTSTMEPQGWLMWRDRPGAWLGRAPVRLGRSSQTDVVIDLRSLGVYRRRQWRFEFSGTEELVLASATEEFEVLGN